MTAIQGHCLCGAVNIMIDGHYGQRVGACHCRMCQRWAGNVNTAFHADAAAVTVNGPITSYQSSPFAERTFCAVCGSHLWYRDLAGDGRPVPGADYVISPGLFDAARDWPLTHEIYADRAFASGRLAGDHASQTRAEVEAESPHLEGDLP